MATMTTRPNENEKLQFRTQVINGKPQIYFDALDEPPNKDKSKRNNRSVANMNANRPPVAPARPAMTTNLKKTPTKSTKKVTFNQGNSNVGVFMTMEEIATLVRTVKEGTQTAPNNPSITKVTTIESPAQSNEVQAPPPPPSQQQQQQQQPYQVPPPALVRVEPPPQTLFTSLSPRQEALSEMAEKKRQKWMREKVEMDRMKLEVEYDQLKHQLSSQQQQKTSSVIDRAAAPLNYSAMSKPPLPPMSQAQEPSQTDFGKTRLMEKKQQQWRQENAERAPVWNPFGRLGAGAPRASEPAQPMMNTTVASYRPPDPPTTTTNIVLNDQTRVPAAMRTNLLFGDVRFEDDVKTAKELERRQWLEDLRRQIEENKRQKTTQLETERRQDFLQETLQPLVQEAADRRPPTKEAPANAPTNPPINTPAYPLGNAPANPPTNVAETKRSTQHDSVVQQTYKKILEATELAKYEKKAQLIEKLKRNGHKTDLLAKTLPEMQSMPSATTVQQKPTTIERTYDSPPKKSTSTGTTTKIEPLHLNMVHEQNSSYRTTDNKRDEAVNTVDSTFRSDHSVQTDFRMMPPKQMFSYTREESDLPPQVPNHLLRSAKMGQTKKNVRIRSSEEISARQRRLSGTTFQSNNTSSKDDENLSQMGTHRSQYGPTDLVHRPLWNYQNPEHREYIPNSRRDPHYEKRHRQKQTEQGMIDRVDDSPKKSPSTRWKSDSELQKPRPAAIKTQQSRDEMAINLPSTRSTRQDAFMITKPSTQRSIFTNISSLDKYEHFIPYTRTDEVLDPSRAYSPLPQSREPSAPKARTETVPTDHQRQRVNPPPYHVPPSRQDHILQQLSAIKENLVRRQQEVTSSMNAIPV